MTAPKSAALIWSIDDWIYLKLPAINGLSSHEVRFPATPAGISAALRTLQNRSDDSTIATAGDPTQHNVDKLVKAFKQKGGTVRRSKRKFDPVLVAKAREILKARGMIR